MKETEEGLISQFVFYLLIILDNSIVLVNLGKKTNN